MSRISCSFYHFYRKGGRSMARSARLESGFQDRLISTLKARFPGCMIFKMDPVSYTHLTLPTKLEV